MQYTHYYKSPLGNILLVEDNESLAGLWFEGQKYFVNGLEKEHEEKFTSRAQAVGGAIAHNKISIIIPCHRVIGTNGSFTGYSAGIDKKIKLLTLEKAIKNKNA